MGAKTYGYARVSTQEQNLDRQLIALSRAGISERDIIVDKESGKSLERRGYTLLKTTLLRQGDTLVVKSLDRLSRNKRDIYNELQYFKANDIHLKVIDLPTTMMDLPVGQEWVIEMVNNILIEVLGTIAEQERVTIHQRQQEGIAAAHERGVVFGRPEIHFPEGYEEVMLQVSGGFITAVSAMKTLGLKKTTFYRLRREWLQENDERMDA